MIYQILGQAIGAYRRRVDPTVDDDGARAAILAALEYAHAPAAPPPGTDVSRVRAPRRHDRPWSRCYLLVGSTGDVIDVHPASARAPLDYAHLEGTRPDYPGDALYDLQLVLLLRRNQATGRTWDALDGAQSDAMRAIELRDDPRLAYGTSDWITMWRAAARACDLGVHYGGADVAALTARVLRSGREPKPVGENIGRRRIVR